MKLALPLLLLVSLAARAVPAPEAIPAEDRIVEQVDFKTANVRAVVDFLREKTGINVITTPAIDQVPVPELRLRNVAAGQALYALAAATGNQLQVQRQEHVLTLSRAEPAAPAPPAPEVLTRAFLFPSDSDEAFTRQVTPIKEAIAQACQLDARAHREAADPRPAISAPLIEVHTPTRLLLVAGSRAGVEIASQIIAAIKGETVATTASAASSIEVSIVGQVHKPGAYTLKAGASFGQLLGQAADFTEFANKAKITVLSKSRGKTIINYEKDTAAPLLQDGDVVTVPEKLIVF